MRKLRMHLRESPPPARRLSASRLHLQQWSDSRKTAPRKPTVIARRACRRCSQSSATISIVIFGSAGRARFGTTTRCSKCNSSIGALPTIAESTSTRSSVRPVRAVPYNPAMFEFGKLVPPVKLPAELGFAGFRVHYPLNTARL